MFHFFIFNFFNFLFQRGDSMTSPDPQPDNPTSARLKRAWHDGKYDGAKIRENFKGTAGRGRGRNEPHNVTDCFTPRDKNPRRNKHT